MGDDGAEAPPVVVVADLKAGRHFAGSFLPPGGLLAGVVRQGEISGALVLLPQGLWVLYRAGEIAALPASAGVRWLEVMRARSGLAPDEFAQLAGVSPARMEGFFAGKPVPRAMVARLMTALNVRA